MLIDAAHLEEVRVAIVEDGQLDRFEFESQAKAPIKGNIYLAKVIRVEPCLQAAFVDYGGGKHGFLSISEIHHDYFQIPIGDRENLEAHIQNAMAEKEDDGIIDEEAHQREISRLRYQFHKQYRIQEVIKKRQIMLVQVMKEERGNKGAALTTYITLAGRYCVLMPNTAKGSGVSKKIVDRSDREKLKKVVSSLHIDHGSVVIRTAGIGRTKIEIKKDFDYLVKVWNETKETTFKSIAPSLIHEEANLIKRMIRDYYSKNIDEIIVQGDFGYKIARDFVRKSMPRQIKNVILHEDKNLPLFSKFEINDQINQIYSTRVDLKSGGYLIINNTEALVSIDVNSGKATKERNVFGTALKTNLEAAEEIARQCVLRDLAGLIVVDFIDMEDKRSNLQVERCFREALKNDKAKIYVESISKLGLLEFSRQRLRSNIIETNMVMCPHCNGRGNIWSDDATALQVLRKIEEVCSILNVKEVMVTVARDVAMYILNQKREFISNLEKQGEFTIRFNIDLLISSSDFKVEHIINEAAVEEEVLDVIPIGSAQATQGQSANGKGRNNSNDRPHKGSDEKSVGQPARPARPPRPIHPVQTNLPILATPSDENEIKLDGDPTTSNGNNENATEKTRSANSNRRRRNNSRFRKKSFGNGETSHNEENSATQNAEGKLLDSVVVMNSKPNINNADINNEITGDAAINEVMNVPIYKKKRYKNFTNSQFDPGEERNSINQKTKSSKSEDVVLDFKKNIKSSTSGEVSEPQKHKPESSHKPAKHNNEVQSEPQKNKQADAKSENQQNKQTDIKVKADDTKSKIPEDERRVRASVEITSTNESMISKISESYNSIYGFNKPTDIISQLPQQPNNDDSQNKKHGWWQKILKKTD